QQRRPADPAHRGAAELHPRGAGVESGRDLHEALPASLHAEVPGGGLELRAEAELRGRGDGGVAPLLVVAPGGLLQHGATERRRALAISAEPAVRKTTGVTSAAMSRRDIRPRSLPVRSKVSITSRITSGGASSITRTNAARTSTSRGSAAAATITDASTQRVRAVVAGTMGGRHTVMDTISATTLQATQKVTMLQGSSLSFGSSS